MDKEREQLLWDYARTSGDEAGEAVSILFQAQSYSYCFSDEFNEMVEKELEKSLDNFEEHYDIVEREEVVPERTYKVTELVPKR